MVSFVHDLDATVQSVRFLLCRSGVSSVVIEVKTARLCVACTHALFQVLFLSSIVILLLFGCHFPQSGVIAKKRSESPVEPADAKKTINNNTIVDEDGRPKVVRVSRISGVVRSRWMRGSLCCSTRWGALCRKQPSQRPRVRREIPYSRASTCAFPTRTDCLPERSLSSVGC